MSKFIKLLSSKMGSSNSKNTPDEQMRMKMEDGLDEEDIEALGLSERDLDKNVRSKSNLSFHTSERFQNDGDEYFNKIYNKRGDKSLSALSSGGGSIGVKSAPPGSKKEKDPEVDAAIAELEETFKMVGDAPGPLQDVTEAKISIPLNSRDGMESSNSETFSIADLPASPSHVDNTRELYNSDESGVEVDSPSESSPCQLQYDRHLITRAGESSGGMVDQNGYPQRPSKFLDLNSRAIGTSGGYSNITYSSSGSSTHTAIGSRGSDQRNLISRSNVKNGRNSSNMTQSILMQQRKDFQRKQVSDNANIRNATSSEAMRQEDWTYQPPKIDGFDIEKFKEINSKVTTSTIVPIIMRDDEDKGYYSRSPEIPAYTKAELDLIASLEREVY